FTFEGSAEGAFERVLLPVFVAPIQGAFGSEFRTDFRARHVGGGDLSIHGLRYPCTVTCIQGPDDPYVLTPGAEADPANTEPTGTPGAFLYVAKNRIRDVAMNVRAYDTSRSAENFGTEIPVVREEEFASEHPLGLVGIPTDVRFRNTLRIYSAGPGGAVDVKIDGAGVHAEHFLLLPEQPDLMHPGYIEFTNFPVNAGTVRVTLTGRQPITSPPSPSPVFWAFVSVTNNETQHITTVTPQP
ncbi:MAG: hypothetical protein ABI779_17135, partial [Acidobacteriota bacterium]